MRGCKGTVLAPDRPEETGAYKYMTCIDCCLGYGSDECKKWRADHKAIIKLKDSQGAE